MNSEDNPGLDLDDPFDAAVIRLNQALARVESRVDALQAAASQASTDGAVASHSDEDRARLADELDAAKAREAELAEAAREASEGLNEAMAEIERVLGGEGG